MKGVGVRKVVIFQELNKNKKKANSVSKTTRSDLLGFRLETM